jgi:hypothetical protein
MVFWITLNIVIFGRCRFSPLVTTCNFLTGYCWDLGGFKNHQWEEIFGKPRKTVGLACPQAGPGAGGVLGFKLESRNSDERYKADIAGLAPGLGI